MAWRKLNTIKGNIITDKNRPQCKIKHCDNKSRLMYYHVDGTPHYFDICNIHHMKKYGYYVKWVKDVARRARLPEGKIHRLRQRAIKRGIICKLSMADFREWINSQIPKCSYCGTLFIRLQDLAIDRLIPKKGYVLGNLTLSCKGCNFIKSNIFTFEEMREIALRYNLKEKYAKPQQL